MFDELSSKLSDTLRRITGKGVLTEEAVREGLREIRRVLLEADVSFDLTRRFLERVQEKAVGQDVLKAVRPGQQLVKVVYDELVALLGEHSAGPVILSMALDMVVTTSLCIALSRLDGAGAHGVAVALRNAARGMAVNPMPWSIVLGGVASALQWQLPGPVDKTLAMLAGAASPVALFTIGAVLARSQMNQHEYVPPGRYVPIALAKLVVHPLLVWCVGRAAIALGAPLSSFTFTVLVLLAALPSASNVALLVERFGAHGGRVARIILVSTALAFLSFSGAVALLL